MKTSMKLSEKQIETQNLTYLNMCRGFLCYKLNNTGIYDPKLKDFRKVQNKFIPKGPSDIFGTYYSRSVYIEVKTPKEYAYLIKHYEELRKYVGKSKAKNHLKDQIRFIESNSALGCIAFFTCSLDMTKAKIKEFTEPKEFEVKP